MTYLELCQTLASESGTVPGSNQPATVTSQTGRLAKIVRWVNDAWRDIQNIERGWLWMRGEYEGDTLLNIDSYTGASLNATRLRDWIVMQPPHDDSGVTVYPDGEPEVEGALISLDWGLFRRTKLRGVHVHDAGPPRFVTVDPQRNLRLSPKPDGVYVIKGEYWKAPQELAANSDVPEMPEEHHQTIISRALDYLGTDDESAAQIPAWSARARMHLAALRRDQLLRIGVPRPLA